MSASPTSELEATFVCDCKYWMRSACAGEPFHKEHQGKRYCLLHFPGQEKSAHFKIALQRKLENKDFDFSGVWFPDDVSFSGFDFSAAAHFNSATFSGKAYFMRATFSAAGHFRSATFNAEAHFRSATFNAEADFRSVTFNAKADFRYATFKANTDFGWRFSEGAFFTSATFADHVRFSAAEDVHVATDKTSLDLQFATIEKPDRVSFHTLNLQPQWFQNVDARKFDFVNVNWRRQGLNEEVNRYRHLPLPLLEVACRNLAVNAEENHRYEEASKFRYMAMDIKRRGYFFAFAPWRLSSWYWLASGYGERAFQALLVLIGILVLFGLLYTQVSFARWEPRIASESDAATATRDNIGASLPFSRALTYSAGVMTLQRPEPKPATTAAQTIVILETILGPVQAALLALAIRRKFMR